MAEPNSTRVDEATHTPSRVVFENLNSMIAEAIVLCQVAQEHFARINREFQRTIQEGRKPAVSVLLEEERARRHLFDARVRLLDRLKALKTARGA